MGRECSSMIPVDAAVRSNRVGDRHPSVITKQPQHGSRLIAAASLLEETRSAVLSDMVTEMLSPRTSVWRLTALTALVKSSSRWRAFVTEMVELRRKAQYGQDYHGIYSHAAFRRDVARSNT